MEKGKIKFYNKDKGFGFILPDGGGGDLFFHVTELDCQEGDLVEDAEVTYETKEGKRGTNAVGIKLQDRVKNY